MSDDKIESEPVEANSDIPKESNCDDTPVVKTNKRKAKSDPGGVEELKQRKRKVDRCITCKKRVSVRNNSEYNEFVKSHSKKLRDSGYKPQKQSEYFTACGKAWRELDESKAKQ